MQIDTKLGSQDKVTPMIPIITGISGILITVVMHAGTTTLLAAYLKGHAQSIYERFGNSARSMILATTAGALAVKHYLDILLWAMGYWILTGHEQFEGFESAVYFSSVTYTSLGYGDMVLTGPWRILCGIQSMNGTLLFGWSTALLFFLVQRLWYSEAAGSFGDSD